MIDADNPRALADAIKGAAKRADGVSAMRGREYVVQHVDRAKIIKQYCELLTEAVGMSGRERGR